MKKISILIAALILISAFFVPIHSVFYNYKFILPGFKAGDGFKSGTKPDEIKILLNKLQIEIKNEIDNSIPVLARLSIKNDFFDRSSNDKYIKENPVYLYLIPHINRKNRFCKNNRINNCDQFFRKTNHEIDSYLNKNIKKFDDDHLLYLFETNEYNKLLKKTVKFSRYLNFIEKMKLSAHGVIDNGYKFLSIDHTERNPYQKFENTISFGYLDRFFSKNSCVVRYDNKELILNSCDSNLNLNDGIVFSIKKASTIEGKNIFGSVVIEFLIQPNEVFSCNKNSNCINYLRKIILSIN